MSPIPGPGLEHDQHFGPMVAKKVAMYLARLVELFDNITIPY